ncbi:MAG TPA: metal-dependent hydrolase [Thermoanaerobaculia bacterium]
MDTITHGIAGSVLSRAASNRARQSSALIVGSIAAMFPDADFFFLSDRLDYLANHRGWSHSFVYMPLFALGFALLGRLVFRKTPLAVLWLIAAVGITSHILFDWITSFGTMFFVPFSRHRYSLDWIFIIDPYFTGIVFAGLVGALLWRSRALRVSRVCAAVLGLYVAFCAVMHHRALRIWRGLDQPPAGATVAVLPQFLSPFRWLGLRSENGEVHAAFFDIGPFARGIENPQPPKRFSELLRSLSDFYPPPARAPIRIFRQAPDSALLDTVRALPDVQIYLAFARFPLVTVLPDKDGGAAITWEDLRFLPWFAGPWKTDRQEGLRREPFVYQVRVDSAGRPTERAFVTRSGRR